MWITFLLCLQEQRRLQEEQVYCSVLLLIRDKSMVQNIYSICRNDPQKMAATLNVHKWHAQNVSTRLVKDLHEPYQALLSASMSNKTDNFTGKHRWSIRSEGAKTGN